MGPFRPGAGGLPPYLAGRQREQTVFRSLLAGLERRQPPPSELVLYGPRGNGKTVLLVWAWKEAAAFAGVDVLTLTPSDFDSKAELAEQLLSHSWWETVRPEETAFRGLTGRPGKDEPAPQLRPLLAMRAGRKPLMILLDEAHTLQPDIGRALLNAAQEVGREAPLLLVLAGTPDLRSHLGMIGASFWNRSRKLPIGRLDRTAAAEAVRRPLESEGVSISDDALSHIVRESDGYPYFVQLWGEAVWDRVARRSSADPRRVTVADAEACQAGFDFERDNYYLDRYDELAHLRLLQPARAVAEVFEAQPVASDTRLDAAIRRGLGDDAGPEDLEAAAEKFRHLGFLWRAGATPDWEPGIPSLMDYIRRTVPAS